MTTPTQSQIHVFLSKAIDLSIKINHLNPKLDMWFYQMVTEQFKIALASNNIIYLQDKNELSNIKLEAGETALVVYDSGEAPISMPGDPLVCIFRRMICLALVASNDESDFLASAPYQLGLDVNRHTLETYKGRSTHYIIPFDLLLYVETEKLQHYGAQALSTNLFNQDGHLFSPHLIPSIVTGFLTKNDLSNMAAFVAQPDMLRALCTEQGIVVEDQMDNASINGDVLLSLKVLQYRYYLPINPENIAEIERFEAALKRRDSSITVNIAGNNVELVTPPGNQKTKH